MLDGLLSFSDPWTLEEDQLAPARVSTDAVFATTNGFLGVRGRRREPVGHEGGGVLLAGCYETRPYAHPEDAFGFPENYQTLVEVTDPTPVSIVVDDQPLATESGSWLDHRRWLDLRTGCVTTSGTWRRTDGSRFRVDSRRMASFVDPSLLWTSVEVEPLDVAAKVEITSETCAPTGDRTFPDEPEALSRAWGRVLRPSATFDRDGCAGLVHRTAVSRRAVACVVSFDGPEPVGRTVEEDRISVTFCADAVPGRPLRVVQRAVYAVGDDRHEADLLDEAARRSASVAATSFDRALEDQRAVLDEFWEAAVVDVDGDPVVEGAVRYSAFQVFQATACAPVGAGPAKGLTGQGYQGHHMWDQEVYVGHALSLLVPDAARRLLEFRHRTLPQARERARDLALDGAQYPWRTIDGTEASALITGGPAQYHVSSAVAWAIGHHTACTGDTSWIDGAGAEVLVEIARGWRSLGHFGDDGSFRIETVTGPDEYTAMVDNNLYTNLTAAMAMEMAADVVERLASEDPRAHRTMVRSLGLREEEPDAWREAAGAVLVPYDADLGVHGQDDSFLAKPRWDLEATPDDRFPLQDHHHLLALYRHQVLKQADVVLATLLVRHRFTAEQRRRNFDHYEPLTAHDSSLSAPIHAMVAADVGHADLAWDFTCDTALTDLDHRFGTPDHGIHLAAAAGAWLAIARGFGGLDLHGGTPTFRPSLPSTVERLRFRCRLHGALVEVEIRRDTTRYRLVSGPPVTVAHRDEQLRLTGPEAVERPT